MTNSILHTVNQSPFERPCLKQCLENISHNDAIVLLENGVLAALLVHPLSKELANFPCFVIKDDAEARGILTLELNKSISYIDYEGFVDLCTQYDTVQSWY